MQRLPYAYGAIQAKYWGVGLFRYFTLGQVISPRLVECSECFYNCVFDEQNAAGGVSCSGYGGPPYSVGL
jgi:hypothetical protein